MRRVLMVAVLVAAAGCAWGEILADYCDGVAMQPRQLVGNWVTDPPQRRLWFGEDGKFVATDLPPTSFVRGGAPLRGRTVEGTWSLEPPAEDPYVATADVRLTERRLTGAGTGRTRTLHVEDCDGEVLLVGEDRATAYHRCGTDCGPVPSAAATLGVFADLQGRPSAEALR